MDNQELIAVNEAIRSHPVETIGKVLRGHMTAMKQYSLIDPDRSLAGPWPGTDPGRESGTPDCAGFALLTFWQHSDSCHPFSLGPARKRPRRLLAIHPVKRLARKIVSFLHCQKTRLLAYG